MARTADVGAGPRLQACSSASARCAARDRTRALVTIAAEVIARYAREKERRALLDYDDLIDKTLDLFGRASAAWVLYKLDLGIDHVLIDEAQDTSPKQWTIVRTIVSEFTPGGARPNVRRTVFAVGDEKQSIFSFQGAAPNAFDEMRRLFGASSTRPSLGWQYLHFHHSFRSGVNVLGSVDQVFGAREVFVSVTTDEAGIPPHTSLPNAAPGSVELWPLIAPAEKKEMEGWDAPFDTESEESPRVLLARKIAAQVKLLDGARPESWRRAHFGAPARAAVRGHHPRAEGQRRAGGRRRPAGADRAYRGDGPDGAGGRAAAAGRRSRAGERAQEPAVRLERGAVVRAGLGSQELVAQRACAPRRATTRLCRDE